MFTMLTILVLSVGILTSACLQVLSRVIGCIFDLMVALDEQFRDQHRQGGYVFSAFP